MESHFSLSLCMIVKDEAPVLARSLASVRSLCKELILVDTGSQDETIQIAKAFGARVFHFAWTDDFSEARNYALSQAQEKWILFLDADEEIICNTATSLQESLNLAQPQEAFALKILNRTDGNSEWQHFMPRLFPNHMGFVYTGKIHEQLTCKTPFKLTHLYSPYICHYGYQTEHVQRSHKHQRNLKLLQKALSHQASPYLEFQLAKTYQSQGDFEAAIVCFEKLLNAFKELDNMPAFTPEIIHSLIALNLENGNIEAANTYCDLGLDWELDTPDFWCYLGLTQLAQQQYLKAISALKQTFLSKPYLEMTDLTLSTWKPHVSLGQAYLALGKKHQAEAHYLQALRFYAQMPSLKNALQNWLPSLKANMQAQFLEWVFFHPNLSEVDKQEIQTMF